MGQLYSAAGRRNKNPQAKSEQRKLTRQKEENKRNKITKLNLVSMMRLLLAAGCLSLASAAPQGLLDGLSNLLTSVVGGSATGEVTNYENAPYALTRTFD